MFFLAFRLSLTNNPSVSDAGYPKSPAETACSEDDDGSDLGSVQLHLQDPHPVPS